MRWTQSEDSPARMVAVEDGARLQEGRLVDLFSAIKSGETPKPPFERLEPYELSSEIMKRYRVMNFGLQFGPWMSSKEFEPGMPPIGWVGFKTFSSRLGTYIEVPFGEERAWNLAEVPSENLCGPGVVVDLASSVGPLQNVSRRHLEQKGKHIREGDLVLIRTNFSDNYYYRPDFLKYTPGFQTDALEWLADKGIKMLITDAAWVEESPWGRSASPREGRSILLDAGIPVLVCAGHMWRLRKERSFIFCSPLPLAGLNTSPCRVLAIEEWE